MDLLLKIANVRSGRRDSIRSRYCATCEEGPVLPAELALYCPWNVHHLCSTAEVGHFRKAIKWRKRVGWRIIPCTSSLLCVRRRLWAVIFFTSPLSEM